MGRTVRTTATTKAVITPNVPTTLTTVYTNNTGRGATLNAVNINGTGNVSTLNTTTGGSDWSHFGSEINPYIQAAGNSGTGFGHPFPVQLSDDRVLLFFLPHLQHRGGDGQDYMNGNQIHTQIVEFQTNKYVCGPVSNHVLPDAAYTDLTYSLFSMPNSMSPTYAQPNWRAIALSSTKVVAAYRIRNFFRLLRFTITGNAVDIVIENLDLTNATRFNTTSNSAFDMSRVAGNTNKIVIGGFAPTNWSLQAFNVPDSGAMTNASSLFSTSIANSAFAFSISRMVNTATANITPYIVAAATAATTGSLAVFNFNDSTNTFALSGSIQALPAASSQWSGIQCGCLSTGTNVSAVVALTATGTGNTITFLRQTSGAGATTAATTLTLQHATAKSITDSFQWGQERVVFVGETGLLVCYDSAGTATNLLPATETTNTERWQEMWIPFNSRPLYNLSDNAGIFTERNHQWMSRTGMTSATSTGVSTLTRNYFPWGHDYGMNYAWHELMNCWVVGQNGRIYLLDVNGVVLNEVALYNLSTTLDWQYKVSSLTVGPSGRIYFMCTYRWGVWGGGSYNCWNTWNNYSDTMQACTTEIITTRDDWSKLTLNNISNISMHLCCNLTVLIEANTARTERVLAFNMNSVGTPQGYTTQWTGTSWSNIGSTGIPTTGGGNTWFRGWRPNYRMIQDTPCSTTNTLGIWRIVGSQRMDSSAGYRQGGISNPFAYTSPGSMSPSQNVFDTTNSTLGWGVTYGQYCGGNRQSLQVVAMYDETRGTQRIWSSINGRLNAVRGYFLLTGTDNTKRFGKVTATKFGYSVIYQNTGTTAGTAIAYIWDTVDLLNPRATLTTASGNGFIVSYPTDKVSWTHYGSSGSVDTTYRVAGIPDDIRFYLQLDDGSGNTIYINNGQQLSAITSFTSLFRSADDYTIPPGGSLKVFSDTPFSLTSLLSISEQL